MEKEKILQKYREDMEKRIQDVSANDQSKITFVAVMGHFFLSVLLEIRDELHNIKENTDQE